MRTFFINPTGEVRREVRTGTTRLDDFDNPATVTVQQLVLTKEGVRELAVEEAPRSKLPAAAVDGRPVRAGSHRPSALMRFDEGLQPTHRDETLESVRSIACAVAGNKSLWKKGVSGTALAFDGYFSKVTLPREKAPAVVEALTVEAWVALGAYPWNDAGIVHCSAGSPIDPEDYKHGYRDPYTYRPWKMKGYLLGVDPYGRADLQGQWRAGRRRRACTPTSPSSPRCPSHLPLDAPCSHVRRRGKCACMWTANWWRSQPASGPIVLPDRDVLIGLNGDAQRISDPVSHSKRAANNNMPLLYGIEGLIDEVRIYDRALAAEEIHKFFRGMPATSAKKSIDPTSSGGSCPGQVDGRPAEKFGATCQTLKFHELWDNLWRPSRYRDIVVRFDAVPASVVFWQGTNFGSGWVTENNKWMSDQSWEIGGPHGCAEHMADKRGRFDHVRLIENTDARVVVHWRYASIDVGYVFPESASGPMSITRSIRTATGVRWVDGIAGGWQDTQFLSQPGTTCLDNIELNAMSVANLRGQSEN